MRYVALAIIFLLFISSCGTTNHLDKYPLRNSTIFCTMTIDPVPEDHAFDATSDDGDTTPFLAKLAAGLMVELLESHPDPMMRDSTLAYYFQDGLESELGSVLAVQSTDENIIAEYLMRVNISDCDLHSNDTNCSVRFSESLSIRDRRLNNLVFEEARKVEVPLRYCGASTDTVSVAGDNLTQWQYGHLTDDEKFAALQCAAFDAGATLADTLASLSVRALDKQRNQ